MNNTDRDTGDKRILSIDPGKSGGWFITTFNIDSDKTLRCPRDESYYGEMLRYHRTGVDMEYMTILNRQYDDLTHVVIEAQEVRRQQCVSAGGVTMYNYGKLVGYWESVASKRAGKALNIHLAIPHKWKKDCGLSKDKEQSRRMAIGMYDDTLWPRKKDEGIAEAALLALWRIKRLRNMYLTRKIGVCGQQMTEHLI